MAKRCLQDYFVMLYNRKEFHADEGRMHLRQSAMPDSNMNFVGHVMANIFNQLNCWKIPS